MAYTINSPFGAITYYDNYGFDYIAQYSDKCGIMFGNYTKERMKITPDTHNITCVFRITKRKPIMQIFILKCGASVNMGDVVYYVANSGAAGIFKYQYVGVIRNAFDDIEYHLFLSEYMVSTISIQTGNESRSISHKKLFPTLEGAIEYKKHILSTKRLQD
jgi:hypothetical protein